MKAVTYLQGEAATDAMDRCVLLCAVFLHAKPDPSRIITEHWLGPAHEIDKHVAMHVLSTAELLSQAQIAALFGRERTSVGASVALVEQLREDRDFDLLLNEIEAALGKALTVAPKLANLSERLAYTTASLPVARKVFSPRRPTRFHSPTPPPGQDGALTSADLD